MSDLDQILNNIRDSVDSVSQKHNADVFIYSGEVAEEHSLRFRQAVLGNLATKKKNAFLVLATYGGDPDAGFRLIRTLKRRYSSVIVAAFGLCKSAGTLIALGADKIIMGEFGEFGPLDIQTTKTDELVSRSSGLDIFKAMAVIQDQTYQSFESFFLGIIQNSGGAISAKTAADIASQLSVGVNSPIMSKIEPLSIGEMQRKTTIATQYGTKLGLKNVKPGALNDLVYGYPSHGFVIDIDEAKRLFNQVTESGIEEIGLEFALRSLNEDLLQKPSGSAITGLVTSLLPQQAEEESNGRPNGAHPNTGNDSSGDAGSENDDDRAEQETASNSGNHPNTAAIDNSGLPVN